MKLNLCKLHSGILTKKNRLFLAAIFFASSSAISLIAQYIPQFHAKALKPLVKIAEGLVQDHDTQIKKQI
jgi:hypothetical protein